MIFAFLLGWVPSARGVMALIAAAVIGWWFGGDTGMGAATLAVVVAAFIRPSLSMWLESVLFALRGICWLFAALKLATGSGPLGLHPTNLILAGLCFGLGLCAHLRIRALIRRGEMCPAALGTSRPV